MSEQKKTYTQDFFERFPSYPIEWDGTPPVCRNIVYGRHACEHNGERECTNCWNETIPEVKLDKIISVGDRVIMVHPEKANTGCVKAGSKGYVLAVNVGERLDILVDWDKPVVSDANRTNFCYNWWVNHESLELENADKETKFKVGDRVVMARPKIANTDGVKAGNKGRVLAFDSSRDLDIL